MRSNVELQQAATEAIAAAEAATVQAQAANARADAATARAEAAEQHVAEYETAEQAQLHAQANAVTNIKTMIPLVLEKTSTFYSRWRTYFLTTVTKYSLDSLVLTDDDFSTDPHWHRMDCTVKSWLFGTVSPDLIEAVSTDSPTSRTIWLGLEDQFIGNKETRAIIMDAEFRTLVQGDLSVTDYLNKMKSMADALGTLGEPVLDRTLVLNVLRGLNERYSHMAAMIKRTRPLPSYSDVRADLLIEEVTLASKSSTPTAFVTSSSPARPPAAHPRDNQGSHTGQTGGGQGSGQGVGSGGQGGRGGGRFRRRWRDSTALVPTLL
jgi:uncharacterized membrane protein YgcG